MTKDTNYFSSTFSSYESLNLANFQIFKKAISNISDVVQPKKDPVKKIPVFWPIENKLNSIMEFFYIFNTNIIPILTSSHLSPAKHQQLKKNYPLIAWYNAQKKQIEGKIELIDNIGDLIFLSSGSTGVEKLVVAKYLAMEKNIVEIDKQQSLKKIVSTALCLPLNYSYPFINQLLWAIFTEKKLHILPPNVLIANWIEYLNTNKIEMLCLVGCQAEWLKKMRFDEIKPFEHIKRINFAGSPFPYEYLSFLKKVFPQASFYNNYGCTEALPRISIKKIHFKKFSINNVGKPLPHTKVKINSSNELLFQSKGMFEGYLSQDLKLSPRDSYVLSGDIVELVDDELFIKGRNDDIINPHGNKISISWIKSRLKEKFPSLSIEIISRRNDSDLHYFLVQQQEKKKINKKEIESYIKSNLESFVWPKSINQLPQWPLLENGKLDKGFLKKKTKQLW